VEIKPITKDEFANLDLRQGRRGRVSYPVIKGFMEAKDPETGGPLFMGMVDRTDMPQKAGALCGAVKYYARTHGLPVHAFTRRGECYLMRLDIDEDGTEIEDWSREPEELTAENL
jgi:hypothetical protein